MHAYNLMRDLVIIFEYEFAKSKIKDQRASIFCLKESTFFNANLFNILNLVLKTDRKYVFTLFLFR